MAQNEEEEDPLDFEEWDPNSSSFVAHMVRAVCYATAAESRVRVRAPRNLECLRLGR